MNTKPLLFAVLAFSFVPARAEQPWRASPPVVPSDAVCRSRPVAGCMDIVIAHLSEALSRPTYAVTRRRVVAHDPVVETWDLREAERALMEHARRLRPTAQLGETIPIRPELTQEIISVYEAGLAHHAIMSAPVDQRQASAIRYAATHGGTPEAFIAAARLLH
jgi:hypothetical protein